MLSSEFRNLVSLCAKRCKSTCASDRALRSQTNLGRTYRHPFMYASSQFINESTCVQYISLDAKS